MKLINRKFLISLSLITFTYMACSDRTQYIDFIDPQEVVPFQKPSQCNENLYPEGNVFSNCRIDIEDCEIISRDTFHHFGSAARESYPNFCMNAPERIYFQNTENVVQAFEVVNKIWGYEKFIVDEKCQNGETYCDNGEYALIKLKSVTQFHYLTMILNVRKNPQSSVLSPYLSIKDEALEDIDQDIDNYLNVFLNSSLSEGSNFHTEYELNGTLYPNVVEGNVLSINSFFRKIYYSVDLGIIGFTDMSLRTWNLII